MHDDQQITIKLLFHKRKINQLCKKKRKEPVISVNMIVLYTKIKQDNEFTSTKLIFCSVFIKSTFINPCCAQALLIFSDQIRISDFLSEV